MTVINDVNDENDPRKNRALANPTTPPPVTAQPPPALAQQPVGAPPPEPLQPPKPVINSGDLVGEPATTDNYQPVSEDLDVSQQESESLPVAGSDPVVGADGQAFDTTNVFPTVNDVNTDIAEQVAGQVDAGLEAQRNTLQNQTLNGSRYPFLLEVESERAKLNRMLDQSNQRLRLFIRDQARREATQQLQAPINPRDIQALKKRDLNPGLDLDPLRSLGNWGLGFLRDIYDKTQPTTGNILVDDPVLRRFRPFGRSGERKLLGRGEGFLGLMSYREFVESVIKNPLNLIRPTADLIASPIAEGEFGDFGDGLIGGLFYTLSLPGNLIVGGLTDLHNKLTGTENLESNLPNIVQSMVGQDFSFSELSAPVTRTSTDPITGKVTTEEIARGANPLAVVGPRENPQTIGELRERSWIWRLGADVLTLGATRLIPEETKIPEFLPERTFQTAEFGAGLLLDVLTPEPGDLARVGSRLIRKTTPEVTAGLARVGDDITDIVVPDEVLLGEFADDIGVGDVAQSRRVINPETIDVPANTVLDDVTNVREVPSVPESDIGRAATQPIRLPDINDVLNNTTYRQGAAEEALAGVGLDLNLPVNPRVVSTPSPLAALPPTSDEINRLGRTEFFRKISIGDFDDVSLSPEVTVNVRRSNAQLTQLATDAGLLPQRNTPLSARRIELLNQKYPGMFERYGQPLHRVSSRELAQKALPPARVSTAELIAAKYKVLPDVDLRVADEFTQQAARVGDFILDKAVNAPRGLRETADLARRVLPKDLVDFNNLEEVQELLSNEQVYEALSNETQRLSQSYVEQVQVLEDLINVVEDTLPDIGRRNLFDNGGELPDISPRLALSPEVPVNPDLVFEVRSETFLHGTKVTLEDFTNIDPVQGASRSETGVGIHFTLDPTEAVNHGIRPVNRNVPNIGQSVNDNGRVLAVQARPRNILDVDEILGPEATAAIQEAIDSVPNLPANLRRNLRSRLNRGKSFGEFIDDIDDVLEKGFSAETFPEREALNLQRLVSRNLREKGVDGVFKRGDSPQLTVFNPNVLEVTTVRSLEGISNDVVSQATAAREATRTARVRFPKSKFAEVNFRESQVTMLTRMAEDTAQQLEDVQRLTDAVADEVALKEQRLIQANRNRAKTRRAQQEQRWKKQNTDQINHFSKPDNTFC